MSIGRWSSAVLILAIGMLSTSPVLAGQFTLAVVDQTGAPVSGFRWLLQEDTTFAVTPGVQTPNTLALGFHKSYHPPATSTSGTALKGNTDSNSVIVTDVPNGRYYVSVLPYGGHGMSGAPVTVSGSSPQVTVTVETHPIPTAQISIFLFHDNKPINGAPDLPEEQNPPVGDPDHVDWTQFSLFLEEPAGRYGIAGGQVIQDAFGNPLGTTYLRTCDAGYANPGTGTNICLDAHGAPIVLTLGDGTLHPDANGFLQVRNLVPAKYGVIMIPPTGSNWQQSSTIEGTKVIDAWVKANEPPFFVEFGPPGPHVFIGFVKSTTNGGFAALPGPGVTVSGTVTDIHMSHPPSTAFYSGRPFPGCWVGLNDMSGPAAVGIYAEPCNGDSTFAIPNVAPGNYQLVVFDANLDVIIAQQGFTVDPAGGTCNGGQSCNFGNVGVFNWFARLNTGIFNDVNQNGFWDAGETGIGPESQDVTLRWRDGTIYQNFPTDNDGFAPFDEVFPFFNWLVAEVSFANKKATGATYVVDAGGAVPPDAGWANPSFDELTPQPQCVDDGSGIGATVGYDPATGACPPGSEEINPNTGNNLSRTETGVVLTTGFQGFLGQTSVMHFGKTDYKGFDFSTTPPTFVGENGGISGIIYSTSTRAENEPQYAVAEEWEPGVPRVQVNLYADGDIDSFPQGDFPAGLGDVDWDGDGVFDGDDDVIDDIDGNAVVTLADIDNAPLGFRDCADRNNDGSGDAGCASQFGPEDVDRDGDGFFDFGDAVQVVWSDSWDDSLPTGCQGETFVAFPGTAMATPTDCFDGLRNWNQIRPGVFDGGYAFADYDMDRLAAVRPAVAAALNNYYTTVGALDPKLQLGLLPGNYIVEAATPPGYEHIKEEDRNVDFGDEYIPAPEALPVACVGEGHLVPPLFSFLTKDGSGELAQALPGVDTADPGNAAPFAGETRPLCDRKKVPLSTAQNAAAEFFLMTDVPRAANVTGMILNDLANEFDPNNPNFGEKAAPPWVPVAFYDWNGKPVNRVYADQFGRFNAVLPSSYTANIGMPSGFSPNMLISCMNDAGPIPDGSGGLMIDPYYDPQYSQFCYTFQYMPGTITYLDTPVLPIAAFAGSAGFPVDCERPAGTPMIASVTRINGSGPFALPGQEIRIASVGALQVPNPEWDGTAATPKTIQRDYGFGLQGTYGKVEIEDASGVRTPLTVNVWTDSTIDATVPASVAPGTYQVVVTKNHTPPLVEHPLAESSIGVTLTVGVNVAGVEKGVRPDGANYDVWTVPGSFATIQAAIDAAAPGDLILVAPGVYSELVIMWKPVKLQGWGAAVTTINARQTPTETLAAWRTRALELVDGNPANGEVDLLPGQGVAPFGFAVLDPPVFPTEEGAGIFVAGLAPPAADAFGTLANQGARIDGFTVVGASTGGGIILNGYVQDMAIGNNRLTGNSGFYGGGIRVGHPALSHALPDGTLVYDDATNDRVRIHHNMVVKNGGFGGAGGGVSLYTGADDYAVAENWVCGNFTQGDGAGIGHLGLSDNGLIEDNHVLFNESFNQGNARRGGGIFIGGQAALAADGAGRLLTPGTGDVTVDGNIVRGNLAGAGDGGGIAIAQVNGADVAASLGSIAPWYAVDLFNNMIDNNVTALAGGGIAVQDALKVRIRNNTVANNDSTATANVGGAFLPGQINRSLPQPAGIVSRVHSPDLVSVMGDVTAGAGIPDLDWLAFSDPELRDVIVLHNRSFYWLNFDNPATPAIETGLFPASCADPVTAPAGPGCDVVNDVDAYSNDLAVMDGITESALFSLDPQDSMLTDTTGYSAGNITSRHEVAPGSFGPNAEFYNGYFNTDRKTTLSFLEFTTLGTAGAFDEGGNFLQVAYGPLSLVEPGTTVASGGVVTDQTLFGYHLAVGSVAINTGGYSGGVTRLDSDIDNEPRPAAFADIGADEMLSVVPAADEDGDGVSDESDNCTQVANADQRDTDGDGFGNICDTDLNNDGITNGLDVGLLKGQYLTPGPHADFNGDGIVNGLDVGILKQYFLKPPGPAGSL